MSIIDSSVRHKGAGDRKENRYSRGDGPVRERREPVRGEKGLGKAPPDAPTRQRRGGDVLPYPGETSARRAKLAPAVAQPAAAPTIRPALERAVEVESPAIPQIPLTGRGRHIVILVENLPVPVDR